MTKILITGGAGYIGSKLVPYLLDRNYYIKVIDNFYYQQTSLLPVCHHKNLEIVCGDVRDEIIMKEALQDVDFIIPLACLTGAPACDKNQNYAKSTNLDSIKLLIELRNKNQKIIYPTTNSGYGVGSQNKECDETSPLNPVSLYGKLKNSAEELIINAGNSTSFRFATVFGVSNRMRTDLMVNDFVYKAFNEKEITLFESHFRRNFLYIGDAIKVFDFAINNFKIMNGESYNVGLSTANLTKLELCHVIQKEFPEFKIKTDEFAKDPDQRDYLVSNEKIKKIGFEAQTDLKTGINELKKAYQFINNKLNRNY